MTGGADDGLVGGGGGGGPGGAERATPVFLWDGDCGFCRRFVLRWQVRAAGRVSFVPYQEAGQRPFGLDPSRLSEAAHLVEPTAEGLRITRGAEAVFRALAHAPGGGAWLALYRGVPGLAAVAEWGYRRVARHRLAASRVVRVLVGGDLRPPSTVLVRAAFLRALGVVFALAFLSYGSQMAGLIGSHGIAPAAGWLERVRQIFGADAFWQVPTVLWWGAGDAALRAVCAGGLAASVLLALGVAPRLALVAVWALYLSLCSADAVFLSYQWDVLLLESAFFALLIAPGGWLLHRARRPARAGPVRLLRFLLFQLMFASGVVKLTSGNEAWRHLTALEYHYWTQPLPTWTAYLVNLMPDAFQRASCAWMFFVELVCPWLLFGPRRVRLFGALSLVALQLAIQATGNFGFFNLLTLALCIPAFDDAALMRAVPRRLRERLAARARPAPAPPRTARRAAGAALLLAVAVTSGSASWLRLDPAQRLPAPLLALLGALAPTRTFNAYGLFADMTETRPEILVQGSADGLTWQTYRFRWKPGPVDARPRFCAPHMPRLDWQMWFAALGGFRSAPWFAAFERRLLEGSEPVLALLAENPFPDAPPRFVRAELYRYRFAPFAEWRAKGLWWDRKRVGPFGPTLTLVDGRLVAVP